MADRVTVDLDDCLYPFCDVVQALGDATGFSKGRTITRWNMEEDFEMTREELWGILDYFTDLDILYSWEPFPGVAEQLQRLVDAGREVNLVTARGFGKQWRKVRRQTRYWLESWEIPHHSLRFTKDKTSVPADWAIDDAPHNVEALTAAGVHALLMDAAHNQKSTLARVHSLHEFVGIVLEATDRVRVA